MYPRTVICLYGESYQEMIELIHQAEKTSKDTILEIRGDYLRKSDLNSSTLKLIRLESKREMILTLRLRKEGGKRDIDDRFRKYLFLDAISYGYDLIDVEFSTNKYVIEELINNKGTSSIIISYHNFQKTDNYDIKTKIEAIRKFHPDIIKIVTMARKKEDNKIIEKILLANKNIDPPLTCFCMGKEGKSSRINGYTQGNALTYLTLNDKVTTALGQLTYNEFLMI